MSFLDQGWTEDLNNSFEDSRHAPIDNTMRYGDNHGEATTKGIIGAALLYALGPWGGGGGAAEGGGEAAAGGGGSGGMLSQFGGSALNNLKGLFGGMGNQQPQQQMMYQNPFSPAQPLAPESPYHPMNFGNQSFTPWMQNVASMGMPRQQILGPAEHIFAQGKGFF